VARYDFDLLDVEMRIITFGTFDLFHIGHLKILERARALGDELVVGISSDALSYRKKERYPVYPENERREIVAGLRCVDLTFFEESLEEKLAYIEEYSADCLVMGDDWTGKFDHLKTRCQVTYLPRTRGISTTGTIQEINTYE
jgi:glycerol-3-phosphate cytidylyltransferase